MKFTQNLTIRFYYYSVQSIVIIVSLNPFSNDTSQNQTFRLSYIITIQPEMAKFLKK